MRSDIAFPCPCPTTRMPASSSATLDGADQSSDGGASTKAGSGPRRSGFLLLSVAISLLLTAAGTGSARTAEPDDAEAEKRVKARETAVALNYSRAAFYRIRRSASKETLIEEQEKILNNLNLNGIADETVVKLYTSVLDEIGQIEIAEREREVIRERHKRIFREQLGTNIFVGVTQVASGQVAGAVRTGVSSWWDYRSMNINRDSEAWKVEKTRLTAVVNKSSEFLDAFWKLSRNNNIPDNWLVREDDLEKLEVAVQEPDLETRLRVLRRMERFMECYPPYWYYVGRTQQQLGELRAAADTYEQLADLGTGHFRKDEMLASGLANLAAIQEFHGDPNSVRTAARALEHSTGVWQANLLCAGILHRHGQAVAAEDAILRNLDVELEKDQSLVALTSLYLETHNSPRLVKLIEDPANVQLLPSPVLMQCVAALGNATPPTARLAVAQSFYGYADLRFGTDDIVFVTAPGWRLQGARVAMVVPGHDPIPGQIRRLTRGYEIRFPNIAELGNPLKLERMLREADLQLAYRNGTELGLTLARSNTTSNTSSPQAALTASRPDLLMITQYQVGDTIASLDGSRSNNGDPSPTRLGSRTTPTIEVSSETADETSEPADMVERTTESPVAGPLRAPVELLPLEPID